MLIGYRYMVDIGFLLMGAMETRHTVDSLGKELDLENSLVDMQAKQWDLEKSYSLG